MIAYVLFFAIPVVVFGFIYLFPSLTGWRALARNWGAKRLCDKNGSLACETEVDWMYGYPWIEVRILEEGVHCQHHRFSPRGLFHAPLLVPWSAVTEVIERPDSFEIRAQRQNVAIRVQYPAELGFPAGKKPNKAPEPTPLPVMPPAEPGVTPGSGVAHL